MAATGLEGRESSVGTERNLRLMGICAGVVGAYAALIGLLVIIIFGEDHQVNVPLTVLCVLGLAVAAAVGTTRRRWTAWLAVAYSAVTLAADAPHQVPELMHPTSTGHTVGAAVLLIVGVAAVLVALWASLSGWSRQP